MSTILPVISPSNNATLDEWLAYLLAIHPSEIDMGLTRVSAVAKRLDVLHLQPAQVITVAGTNGKGTTCAMLESVLLAAGKTVGVYSSPHLLRYNERIRINQQDVADQSLIEAFKAIEQARAEISLTFFEYATLAGLYLFKAANLNVIILEVGLGGRLDATNMVDSSATVLTSVDLDHQEYLGNTRELVGREKAGVFRPHCIAVVGEPDIPSSVIEYASSINTQLVSVNNHFSYSVKDNNTWEYTHQNGAKTVLPQPSLPIANAACVVALVKQMWPDIADSTMATGLINATLPGRLEKVSSAPLVLLDVAHNPHAARYLSTQLQRYQPRRIFALCGMLKDKDIRSVLSILDEQIFQWNMVTLDSERGASAKMLVELLPSESQLDSKAREFDNIASAWQAIQAAIKEDDVVIVFGSFYTVAGFKHL